MIVGNHQGRRIELKNKFISAVNFFVQLKNKQSNDNMYELVREYSEIDSIDDFNIFCNFVKKLKEENTTSRLYEYHSLCKEAFLYGHLDALCTYAGIPCDKRKLYPNIEHGINFSETSVMSKNVLDVSRCIYQGTYKLNKDNNLDKYAIGPYIRYVAPLEDGGNSLKKKINEKNLVVFPSHSYEFSKTDCNERQYVNQIIRLAKDYDNIVVCAYWNNVNDQLYQIMQANGIKIVSAGIRFDPLFIVRLKHIINYADTVAGDDLGTFIGYGYEMGKKIILFRSDMQVLENQTLNVDKKGINADKLRNAIINQDISTMSRMIDYYWGISIDKNSPEQIRKILQWR